MAPFSITAARRAGPLLRYHRQIIQPTLLATQPIQMMHADEQILVRILGETDAIWLPVREFGGSRPCNTYCARRDYAVRGIPWRSGGRDERAREEAQRQLEDIADKGLVKVFRPRRGKILGVRLVEATENRLRNLCGLPSLDCGLSSLAEVARLATTPEAWLSKEILAKYCKPGATAYWVPERALAKVKSGDPDWKRELMLTEDLALPALARWWLESGADRRGNVAYHVAKRGRAVLADGFEFEDGDWIDFPKEPVREAHAHYIEAVKDALDQLGHAEKREPREIGFLPLPVSGTGMGRWR